MCERERREKKSWRWACGRCLIRSGKESAYSFSPARWEEQTEGDKRKQHLLRLAQHTHPILWQEMRGRRLVGGITNDWTVKSSLSLSLPSSHSHLSIFLCCVPSLLSLSPCLSYSNLWQWLMFLSRGGCIDRAAELINEMHCCTAGALAEACPAPPPSWTHIYTPPSPRPPADSEIKAVKVKVDTICRCLHYPALRCMWTVSPMLFIGKAEVPKRLGLAARVRSTSSVINMIYKYLSPSHVCSLYSRIQLIRGSRSSVIVTNYKCEYWSHLSCEFSHEPRLILTRRFASLPWKGDTFI